MFQTLDDAIKLAEFAHRHQYDKSGFAYVEHPKRVLAAVQAQGAPPFVQIAAVLHDVCEDTPFTPEILTTLGFSDPVVILVRKLSRRWYGKPKHKTDDEYYQTIADDPFASLIKWEDMSDNSLEWRLVYLEPDDQDKLRTKYDKGRAAIRPGMARWGRV